MTDSDGYSERGGKQRGSQTLLPSNPAPVGVNKDEWQPIRVDSSEPHAPPFRRAHARVNSQGLTGAFRSVVDKID